MRITAPETSLVPLAGCSCAPPPNAVGGSGRRSGDVRRPTSFPPTALCYDRQTGGFGSVFRA